MIRVLFILINNGITFLTTIIFSIKTYNQRVQNTSSFYDKFFFSINEAYKLSYYMKYDIYVFFEKIWINFGIFFLI